MSYIRRSMMMSRGVAKPYDAEIEYLESSGTQYINTGITLAETDKIELTIASHTSGFITGRNGAVSMDRMFIYNNILQWSGRPSGYTINNGNQHTIELKKSTAIVDGTTYTTTYNTDVSETGAVLIFAAWHQANASETDYRMAACKIYSFDILDANDNYRFKAIPVRVGQVGYMYDQVSGQLFGNAGSGDFTIGNDL